MVQTFTYQLDTPAYSGSISVNTGLYINGRYVDPVDLDTIEYVCTLWSILPALTRSAVS